MPAAAPPEIDRLLHALADASRRGLVEQLARGPASVSELAAPAAIGLPAVLKHLRILEQGGIVVSGKIGRVRTYRMQENAFAPLNDWLAERQAAMQAGFDRLTALMLEIPEEER